MVAPVADDGDSDDADDLDGTSDRSQRLGNALASPGSRESRGRRRGLTVQVATIVVGAAVATIAVAAMILLSTLGRHDQWTPVLQDILKTAYQALTIGALGGLAKLLIDRRKQRDREDAELRDRRQRFIGRVVNANREIENTRLLILANRSVKTWTEAVTGALVPARTSLGSVVTDLANWADAEHPVFHEKGSSVKDHQSAGIRSDLVLMCDYLYDLIKEHAEHKQRLSEMQRIAATMDGPDRQAQLDRIWKGLRDLRCLSDFLDGGENFRLYKDCYSHTVIQMRSSLGRQEEPGR